MLASGNGDAARCVENLVKTIQGEVPFERFKGLPREIIDRPADNAYRAEAAIQQMLKIYEPRVLPQDVSITFPEPGLGIAGINIEIE